VAEFVWIDTRDALAYHDLALVHHGGAPGVRDKAGLEAALARPKNLLAYGEKPTVFQLAAAYAYGIARSHPFVDGNKRSALIVAITFLEANGFEVVGPREDEYLMFFGIAEGRVSEDQLAQWIEENSAPVI
jgi:death-on-curing protein